MIIELSETDNDLINQLEDSFKEYFKNNSINDDFKQNIFSKYFIYKEKSNIIGFVNYYDLYDRYEIAYIEVNKDFRNQKIGSKMIEYLINKGIEENIINITLEVNMQNINAIKLYTKYDFKNVAVRKRYYNGIDGYLMERKMM